MLDDINQLSQCKLIRYLRMVIAISYHYYFITLTGREINDISSFGFLIPIVALFNDAFSGSEFIPSYDRKVNK
jgi:hypothetical protein